MRRIFSTFSYQKKVNILSCLMISFLCAFVFLTPAVQVSRADTEVTEKKKSEELGEAFKNLQENEDNVRAMLEKQIKIEQYKKEQSANTDAFYKAYDLINGPFEKVFDIIDKENGGILSVIQMYLTDSMPESSVFYNMGGDEENASFSGSGISEDFKVAVNFLTILGAGWMLIIAMTRMFTSLEQGKDPQEVAYKAILEICIAGIIILELPSVLTWIQELGNAVLNSFLQGFTGEADYKESCEAAQKMLIAMDEDIDSWDEVREKGWGSRVWWDFWMCRKFDLINILCWICELVMQVIILSYFAEFGIRKIFSPLAIADVYSEGMRSSGMRFLKKTFAIYLKIAICMLSAGIGYKIMKLSVTSVSVLAISGEEINFPTILVTMLVGTAVAIAMMTKGAGIADEALGV